MSFQPVIPAAGYAGWAFLSRTLDQQSATHARAPAGLRDETYFRNMIGSIETADDLVSDRRLLRVALTAFGLEEDLPNKAFIGKVLQSQTSDRGSFVNRLADKRYVEFARAFGFGDGPDARHRAPGFAEGIVEAFRARRFEASVGAQDESMRLALALKRDLPALAASGPNDDTLWYRVLGTPSLRKVFESAYGLPASFGALDVDRQAEIMKSRSERSFGKPTVAQFADPHTLDRLIRRFFVGEQLAAGLGSSAQSAALSLIEAAATSMRSLRNGNGTRF